MNPLAHDLDELLSHTHGLWEPLRGARLFITGGTGFIGTWLLESFAWANDRLGLGASAVVLSRDPARFAAKSPHIASHPSIKLIAGDVTQFDFPQGPFTHVIHAATEASAALNERDPLRMSDTIVGGTRRVLDFARHVGVRRLLLTSSGAVYGPQPPELSHIPENHGGGPDATDVRSAYGEGKRMAEWLCAAYAEQYGIECLIARCFAFIGPHLPLDAHFAAGNFIRDALAGGPIRVRGDGTPLRSYLYAADLAAWLWTILIKGTSARPYNVGSSQAVSIAELATATAAACDPAPEVRIAETPRQGRAPLRYVPATDRACDELGLRPKVLLPDAIARTMRWARADPDSRLRFRE
jgi:nucleoside-diphosphate-sugar epimerase